MLPSESLVLKTIFLNWVRLLHLNAEGCVVNNGVSSEYFNLNRGTPQGDQLAAYIFILVMQILSSIIKHNSNIEAIPVNNEKLKWFPLLTTPHSSLGTGIH